MEKVFIFVILTLFITSFIFAQNSIQPVNDEEVCCKTYGLGTMMKKVNIRYGWAKESECITPEGLLGGGREIVDDKYCENTKIIKTKILTKQQVINIIRARNRLRINQTECPDNCTCTGSTIKCPLEDGGRNMTVIAGKSGNIIVQVKKVNMSTNVTLYKSNKTLYGVFKNNETRTIKVFPDHVQEKIREKIKARLQNQTIELDEDGMYQVQGRKKARLFFIFPVRERVTMQIDSETGEVIKIRNPWWGFLARDTEEEENEEE